MIEQEKYRQLNLSYYQDIEQLYKFFVEPNSMVLEVGSGLGYLLNIVQPKYGLGIDNNPEVIKLSQSKFPQLEFLEQSGEDLKLEETFDYILLGNTISYLHDIEKTLLNLRNICHPHTRLILTFHNPAWEFVLRFATLIKQRMPIENINWLSYEDLKNILILEGFDVVSHGKRMLFPRRIPLLFELFNKILAPLPIVNQFCLTEYIVARREPESETGQKKRENLSCSVIIPAKNEAGNINNCLEKMPRLGNHTEIIFLEGNSTDNTWEEMLAVQKTYTHQWDIQVIRQEGNGKGDAVRQGLAIAKGDILIILDADLTVQPEDLVYFFKAVASGKCELANGCRLIYPVSYKAMPWLNRLANRFFAWLISYLFNINIKDSLCGTKAISRENYQKIAANRTYFFPSDPFGDFDLIFGAAKLGLKIRDIPVRYLPRSHGKSNISHFKDGIILLKMCFDGARKFKFY